MASPEEIVERRRAVAAVMATPGGVSRTDAAALAAEFGCCVSTVWGDRRAILERFSADSDLPRPLELSEWKDEVNAAIKAASLDGAHSAVLSGLALRAKVTGLEAPAKSEVKHTGAVSIAGLSDEQAEALAAALDAVEEADHE